jgi:hypothetical protein
MACAGLLAVAASPALAAVDDYSIEPSQRLQINLEFCSAESQLAVRGDTSTDLDFEVTGPSGESLMSDAGIDDYLSLILENDSGECAQFALSVSNLGDEKNDFTVVLTPIAEGSTRVRKYIIQGEATEKHSFKACGTSARVSARGDGDTDLDFVIRNADGGVVHEDAGTSDETSVELSGLLSNCEEFEIEVTNLGSVYNAMMLVVEPEGASSAEFAGTAPSTNLVSTLAIGDLDAGPEPATVSAEESGPGEYNVSASTRLLVDLPVCGVRRLEVRGNGASDLDFTVSDSAGEQVHSDVDLTDVTFKTLEAGSECETYSLAVNNLGDTANVFEVTLIDPATRVGEIGAGEYRIEANTSTKVALQVCDLTQISARGGGGTDLDFDVTDAQGSSVHSDYDLTDATEFTIDPEGKCKDYQISVSNLGDTQNMLTIAFGKEGASLDPRKQDGPFVARPSRPNSAIARPGQIAGFRKGMGGEGAALNRNISLLNNTGEAVTSLYWSNSATIGWGKDMLTGSALARNQQWNIEVTDGSDACLFDFRAITASEREIEIGQVNVCEESVVAFE